MRIPGHHHMYKSWSILVFRNIIHQATKVNSSNSITSLNISIQAVQLLSVLAHHSPNHVSNWHHALHALVVDDGYVPNSVICPSAWDLQVILEKWCSDQNIYCRLDYNKIKIKKIIKIIKIKKKKISCNITL